MLDLHKIPFPTVSVLAKWDPKKNIAITIASLLVMSVFCRLVVRGRGICGVP